VNGIIGPAGFPLAIGCPAAQHDRIVASEQVASSNKKGGAHYEVHQRRKMES
jgi:hypothetical protein